MTSSARLALPALLAVTLLGVSACAADEADQAEGAAADLEAPLLQPGRPGEGNATLTSAPERVRAQPAAGDVEFMQHMVVHHAQAVEMVDLAEDELTDPQVLAIAERIRDAQKPEIAGMAQWLEGEGAAVPAEAAVAGEEVGGGGRGPRDHGDHQGGHDAHSGAGQQDMPGMASPEQLVALGEATGPEADVLFLELMIVHHEGAMDMSVEQRTHGRDELVGEVADDVYAVQAAEIDDLEEMLQRLSP